MTLDDILSQPLPALRDDGFSAQVLLKLRRADDRRRLLAWAAAMLALLPLVLALAPTTAFLMNQVAPLISSRLFAYAAGVAVLAWTLRPEQSRFF